MKQRLLLLAALALATQIVHAHTVVNRVTLSGKITSVTEPVVKETATVSTYDTKFKTVALTNASILDALVASGDITDKKGYAIVEISGTQADSSGYFARNSRSGDTVAIPDSLLSSFTNLNVVSTESSAQPLTGSNAQAKANHSFIATASATLAGATVAVSYSGSSSLHSKTVKIAGETTKIPYVTSSLTAVLTGITEQHEAVNAKLTSSGGALVIENPAP